MAFPLGTFSRLLPPSTPARPSTPSKPSAPTPAPSAAAAPVFKKAVYVGRVDDGGIIGTARAFARFDISGLAAAVPSARLEWHYVDKANPTGNVALIEIADFGTLDPADWGSVERATITATAITPATTTGQKLSLDVTTRYNQAKTDGLSIFAVKLQYATEAEGLGTGRWYRVGSTGDWAPVLVVTETQGQDLRVSLLATPVAVDLAAEDALGDRAAVITAGDGATYPPLGDSARLAATLDGLEDDGDGTYTGTPAALIEQGPDLIRFLLQSAEEGCGMTAVEVEEALFTEARSRLADWFPLAGGLTEVRDVREWAARIARSCRAFTYLTQDGREALYVEPTGGSGATPVRTVRPWEHGALRLAPLAGEIDAPYPISRVEVFYGLDYLGLTVDPWLGHALIAAGETDPLDADRDAQAVDAQARYGVRSGDVGAQAADTGYEWVPLDRPGVPTGVSLRNWLWDKARARPVPGQVVEVALPRFALGWRLLDEFTLESYHFPSAAARMRLGTTPFLGSTETGPTAYQARSARCQVRDLPQVLAESGSEFPVRVTALILAWEGV